MKSSEQELQETNAKLEFADKQILDIEKKLIDSNTELNNLKKERKQLVLQLC